MSSVAPGGMDPQKVELVLAELDSLPPLAPVATRILALTGDSETHAKEIVRLIESDPSLTARFLSVLGRAEHGVRREAITVENAVRLLGFDTIRQLTLSVKVMEVFGSVDRQDGATEFDRPEFWKHCLGVACAARRIAQSVSSAVRPEEAFVLGLLHDIGKDALHATLPKSFAKVIRSCRRARIEIVDAERAVLGVDHTIVGRRLAERWRLPQPLVESIWLHHQAPEALPASVGAGKHVQIVQLADALVRELRIGFSGSDLVMIASRDLAESLGLPEAERLAIVESLADEIEARAAWIGADEITSSEVYLKALMRSSEELTVANLALLDQNKRLQHKAEYFAALGWLNQAVSPRASVREVCGVGAETLRRALSVPAVLVCVTSGNGRWVDLGFSDATVSSEIIERAPDAPSIIDATVAAVQAAMAGTWIVTPDRAFDRLIEPYRGRLGEPGVWLLPLVREQRWVGGAFFGADNAALAGLRAESAGIEALSAAVGLAIAQSQAQTAAIALSDELAEANRRWSVTQAELLRARTLQTVVTMAAGAAHELNNPLAVISGRAQLLHNQLEDAAVRESLDAIAKQAHACSDIVTELMEFAQPQEPSPETIHLQDLLVSLRTELLSAGLLDAAAISVEVASDTPPVQFDRERLTRLFRELIHNAIEATGPDSRRLTVKAARDLTEDTVVVVVRDNGRGMTLEVAHRAMDPFFSYRPAGRGRGLGLARVSRWLQQGHGTIRIESEPGEGTTVELRLPAARGSSA